MTRPEVTSSQDPAGALSADFSDTGELDWRDYFELTKPKVVSLIVFTAVVGMFLATPSMVPIDVQIFGTIGIGLSAASGAAFNHVIDQRIDAIMARTASARRREKPTAPPPSRKDALLLAGNDLPMFEALRRGKCRNH